jgi:parallel beta-helix repeat protein
VRLALLAVTAVALFACLGNARAAATLTVDDDGAQCPSAPYSDIQSALDDAEPGDTIVVCPGTYDPAEVDTSVTIRGFTKVPNASACADPDYDPDPNDAQESVVDGGFSVFASHVTITGFTIFDADSGVYVSGGSSVVGVSRNVIEQNSIGVYMNGSRVTVDGNCIRDNNAGGAASGNGIYSDQGLSTGTIVGNVFSINEETGVNLIGDGTGSVDSVLIDGNASSSDGDLVSLIGVTNSTISNNNVTGATGSAIYVQSANHGLTIDRNTLTAGEDEGIAVDAADGSATEGEHSDGLSVTQNTIKSGATDNEDAGIAIYFDSLDNSTFFKNKVQKNGYDGLFVDDGNAGNTFDKNDLKGNQKLGDGWDCHDDSGGANTWIKDKGKTENVKGLCKGAKVT